MWGPQKTGKTTFLRDRFPQSPYFDFLRTDLFLELSREPFRLRELLHARPVAQRKGPVILDEVQKVPLVLDEVQGLMEEEKMSFILCGSSARKLIRGRGNLMGGRAWRHEMLPLTSGEIGDVDLLKALNNGLIPSHYAMGNARWSLDAYAHEYLKEEVFA